jgi:hypothetical protein
LAWFPAFYSAGEPGQVVLLPRKRGGERQRLAHRLAVHVAILDQNVGGGLAGASVDHQLARQALLWGDAYLSWLALGTVPQHGDVSQRVQWAEEQLRDRLGRPPRRSDSFLRRLAWQVLQQGVRAAATVRDTSPWRALDDMYRNGLPRSTAQVLHPTWLLEDRRARTVEISPLELFANVAPGGPPQQGQVGELRLRLWLEKYLSADVAYNATAGWAGDAYQLYPNARGAEGRELLVLASAWDMTGETTAEQEAQEFAEAVGLAMDQLAGDRLPGGTGAPTGAVRWRTAAGQGILVEQRGDQVLVVMHCPSDSFDQAGPHIWSNVQVGRLDLSPLVDEDAQITTPIAPVEPAPPWYRRTPGVVALVLWLFVLLPGLCVALTRRGGKGRKELARLYLRGLALTVAIVFIIWLTGR